jgi:hypothetical protein
MGANAQNRNALVMQGSIVDFFLHNNKNSLALNSQKSAIN